MTRPRGGYIGFNRVPAATALNSAASGVWTLREAEALKRAGTWPTAPPGGVGSGLQLWLDAADPATLFDATTGGSLVAADGGVARWEDKSGNARHATQGTSANRPLRKTAIQGGKDGLDFDGSNDFLRVDSIATFFAGTNNPFTVFCVFKGDSASGTYSVVGAGRSSSTDGWVSLFGNNDLNKLLIIREPDSGSDKRVTGGTNVGTSARVATYLFNGSNGQVYLDGTSDSSATNLAIASSFGVNQAAIGVLTRNNNNNNLYYTDGRMFEVIIYDSALSDANREAVENYLLAKWGIT